MKKHENRPMKNFLMVLACWIFLFFCGCEKSALRQSKWIFAEPICELQEEWRPCIAYVPESCTCKEFWDGYQRGWWGNQHSHFRGWLTNDPEGDYNQDGIVNLKDWAIWSSYWQYDKYNQPCAWPK